MDIVVAVHHIVSGHLARCTIRQELAASLVASLVLFHQYSRQRRRETYLGTTCRRWLGTCRCYLDSLLDVRLIRVADA